MEPDRLGSVMACPTPECTLELRVNPFVVRAGQALASTPAEGAEGVIEFYPSGLLHKFGFGDGDMLEDLREEHGLKVDRSDLLAAVVERLVVPRLDQRVETYTLASMHNPIRARTVDGDEADMDSTLTPEVIEVPVAQILEVARTLSTVQDDEEGWRT